MTASENGPTMAGTAIRGVSRKPTYREFVVAMVLVWGVGDVLSTYWAMVLTGGVGMEANPLVRGLLAHEPLLLLGLKAAVVLYAGVLLLEGRPLVERVPGWRIWFTGLILAGTAVVLGNLATGLLAL
jgi:hypothetical protein